MILFKINERENNLLIKQKKTFDEHINSESTPDMNLFHKMTKCTIELFFNTFSIILYVI